MLDLGDEIHDRCGCVLQETHGLPCSCVLYNCYSTGEHLNPDLLHPFWRTLIIGEQVDRFNFNTSADLELFDQLAIEARSADPAILRKINKFIRSCLHPDACRVEEPAVKENVRGRPKTGTSTKRAKSAWEYMDSGRGRPSTEQQPTTGQRHSNDERPSTGHGPNTDKRPSSGQRPSTEHRPSTGKRPSTGQRRSTGQRSSTGQRRSTGQRPSTGQRQARPSYTRGGWNTDITEFENLDQIPPILVPYVVAYLDVLGDGNCGFRVVAHHIYGNDEAWPTVREQLAEHINMFRAAYETIYYRDIDGGIARLTWTRGQCGDEHWFDTGMDCFAVATLYNAVVYSFNVAAGAADVYWQCQSYLPLFAPPGVTGPVREIVMCQLYTGQHYIRLALADGFPCPPVHRWWHEHRHESVAGWDIILQSRIQMWTALVNDANRT